MGYSLEKIVSGGQTGVDIAALQAAYESGFQTGGWCPPDTRNEQGLIPAKYRLKPTPLERSELAPDVPRSQRTEWNVRDSDGTLIITDTGHQLESGTLWTRQAALLLSKPILTVDFPVNIKVELICHWLVKHQITILNIAGPGENEVRGIQSKAYMLIKQLLINCRDKT